MAVPTSSTPWGVWGGRSPGCLLAARVAAEGRTAWGRRPPAVAPDLARALGFARRPPALAPDAEALACPPAPFAGERRPPPPSVRRAVLPPPPPSVRRALRRW